MKNLILFALLWGGFAQADKVQEEKERLFFEARNVGTASARGKPYRDLQQELYERKDGNPNTTDIQRMMEEHWAQVAKRDRANRVSKLPLETNTTILTQPDPQCGPNDPELPIQPLSYSLLYNEGDGKGARWGHVMQRFEYCRDGHYYSFVFTAGDVYIPKVTEKAVYEYGLKPEDVKISPEQKGRVLFGWMVGDHRYEFRRRIIKEKRTLYEVYFDVNAYQIYWALLYNTALHLEQKEQLLTGKLLQVYSTPFNNCNRGFKETINHLVPGYTDSAYLLRPIDVFKFASQRLAKRVVVYPKEAYQE